MVYIWSIIKISKICIYTTLRRLCTKKNTYKKGYSVTYWRFILSTITLIFSVTIKYNFIPLLMSNTMASSPEDISLSEKNSARDDDLSYSVDNGK